MREAARLPEYYSYLTTKYQWRPQVPPMIEWTIIEFAMRKLNVMDQICIKKSTNGALLRYHQVTIPVLWQTNCAALATATTKLLNT